MSQEQEISVYKINTDSKFFDKCDNDFSKMVELIILEADKNNRKKSKSSERGAYTILNIKEGIDKYGLNVRIYHSGRTLVNTWTDFLREASEEVKNFVNQNHDFISFVYDEKYLFCFTGGIAHNLLNDIYDEGFSKDLIMKLADPEKIKSLTSRLVSGSLYARDIYFRGNATISSSESFGVVWKRVKISLKKDVYEDKDWEDIFGKGFNNLNCDAGSSFQIKKKISFQSAIKLIKKIIDVYNRPLTEIELELFSFLNKIRLEEDKDVIERLNNKLIDKAISYLNESIDEFDYDFCHKEYEKFNSASNFVAKESGNHDNSYSWPSIDNAEVVLNDLEGWFNLEDRENFCKLFTNSIKIISEHNDDKDDTKGSIMDHLHGEIFDNENGKTYFRIDKKWYFVDAVFLDSLNKDFESYINSVKFCDNIPVNNWSYSDENKRCVNKQKEGHYNELHLWKPNFIVGDRVTVNGLELFDLLYINGDDLYIIQVKDGFSASIRDACSQLRNSSKIIEEDVKLENSPKLREYYAILDKKGDDNDKDPMGNKKYKNQMINIGGEESFINLFKSPNVKRHYVLAFHYASNGGDILKSKSSIAKFEVLGLKNHLQSLGIKDLDFLQIKD